MRFSIFVQSLEGDISLERSHEKMADAVEDIMDELESHNYSIALWQDEDQNNAEIVFLDDSFKDVYHININKILNKKEEKSDALLLQWSNRSCW